MLSFNETRQNKKWNFSPRSVRLARIAYNDKTQIFSELVYFTSYQTFLANQSISLFMKMVNSIYLRSDGYWDYLVWFWRMYIWKRIRLISFPYITAHEGHSFLTDLLIVS